MLMWLIIAIFTIGNFVIPIESSLSFLEEHSIVISSSDKFCLEFPPSCSRIELNKDLSDVEIFQEVFCPSKARFRCLEEFGRRCISTNIQYYDFLMKVVDKNRSMIHKLQLCSDGPYKKEHLEHAHCLVSMFLSSSSIPLCASVEDYKHRHHMGAKESECILNAVGKHCGRRTEMFFDLYILKNPGRIY
ncbi:uncharacterized protein LOC112691443 [Sipha flava]|uniref:Uncharacterized protein LOC112691443 n=1 Tax=Sipha flava TaxID=143950 RepID=A0A2S2Q2P9_9HEMI|nr:uncharacterized protein LOC112691443 [Sipha flava]